jgi:hypothetical protein
MTIDIPDTIAAIAALGTASYGLVDACKAVYGGISNAGFVYIRRAITWLFPKGTEAKDSQIPLSLGSILATVNANWINGTPLSDQKAIAKTLIKLRLNAGNAAFLAEKVGVDPAVLSSVAGKIGSGEPLSQGEADVFGRFDLLLTAALDEGYQRADQRYRNWCKAMAIPVSVALAVLGGWTIQPANYFHSSFFGQALIAGFLATPLAPVAKDLSSAVQAGAKAIQAMRK